MAATAGVSELGGGLLTLSGLAHPLGPVTLAGTMAVASTTHRANGPFAAKRGFELLAADPAAAKELARMQSLLAQTRRGLDDNQSNSL